RASHEFPHAARKTVFPSAANPSAQECAHGTRYADGFERIYIRPRLTALTCLARDAIDRFLLRRSKGVRRGISGIFARVAVTRCGRCMCHVGFPQSACQPTSRLGTSSLPESRAICPARLLALP